MTLRGARRGAIGLAVALCGACSALSGPEVITLFVGPELVDCVGVGPRSCMQVRESPDGEWRLFYNAIEGFDFESGFFYELKVEVQDVPDPPADASSLRYILREVVEKTPAS